MERTLILVKPDGVARGLVGADPGAASRTRATASWRWTMRVPDRRDCSASTMPSTGKPFFQPLVEFIVLADRWWPRRRGAPGDRGVPVAGRRHRPGQGAARHDPRRLGREWGLAVTAEHRARLGLGGVGPCREIELWFPNCRSELRPARVLTARIPRSARPGGRGCASLPGIGRFAPIRSGRTCPYFARERGSKREQAVAFTPISLLPAVA